MDKTSTFPFVPPEQSFRLPPKPIAKSLSAATQNDRRHIVVLFDRAQRERACERVG
jgi:hypothetical protein